MRHHVFAAPIYKLAVPFFEGGDCDWMIELDLRVQLARCFSFDPALLGRLMIDCPPGHAGQT